MQPFTKEYLTRKRFEWEEYCERQLEESCYSLEPVVTLSFSDWLNENTEKEYKPQNTGSCGSIGVAQLAKKMRRRTNDN